MQRLMFSLGTLALVLSACSTTVIDSEQRLIPDGQDPFTGTSLEMDPAHSFIAFEGRSTIINHEGTFDNFTVTITPHVDVPQDFTKARVDVVIDATSVQTDAEGLTRHLRAADFFDADVHPMITFRSTSIVSTGGNTYQISGELTVKGVALPATFDAQLTDVMLQASYALPRRSFGIGNDAYGDKLLEPLVPVEVQIVFRS